jgi:glutamine synthetase
MKTFLAIAKRYINEAALTSKQVKAACVKFELEFILLTKVDSEPDYEWLNDINRGR